MVEKLHENASNTHYFNHAHNDVFVKTNMLLQAITLSIPQVHCIISYSVELLREKLSIYMVLT